MDTRGQFTREEIYSQPEAWESAIRVLGGMVGEIQKLSRKLKDPCIIFTGCGSTYYLACAAAALFRELTGIPAYGLPASELWLGTRGVYDLSRSNVLIAVSRSGETSETLQACEKFSTLRIGELITLVCDPQSSLASMGSVNIILPSGMEQSIAQTRAFSTLYLAATWLSTTWAGRPDLQTEFNRLPALCRNLLDKFSYISEKYGRDLQIDRVYYLGSGGRYGLACELNLKMKEMSLTHSEAFHFLEFRHGPKAMVTPDTLVVGLVSEINRAYEQAVLGDVSSLGAQVVSIGESGYEISFNSGIEEVMRNILYLPVGQIMAFERALAKGYDPDRPKHLDPVVILSN